MSDRYTIEITLDGKDNVSQNLSKVNNELGKLERQGQAGTGGVNDLAGGFRNLGNSIQNIGTVDIIAGMGLMEIGQKVGELNQLGAEVRATQRVFEQMTGGPEAAAEGLGELRRATHGVVDICGRRRNQLGTADF